MYKGFNVSSIAEDYEAIKERIATYQRIGDYNLQKASLSRLNDLISIFERQLGQIESWQETLISTTEEMGDFRIELIKHMDRLKLDESEFDDLQRKYYETRHVPLIREADSLNQLLEIELQKVLELEYDISKNHATLYRRVQDIKDHEAKYWENVMRKEQLVWSRTDAEESFFSSREDQLSTTTWRIVDFFEVNIDRVFLLLIILIGTYIGMRYIKRKDKENPESQQYPMLYQSPIAISLLIAGLLFPVIFPPTTSLMYDFAVLVSYIPFLYILYQTLTRKHFIHYTLFFVFLVLLKVQSLFAGASAMHALLVIICGSFFIYIIYNQALREYFQLRWKWTRIISWMLGVIIVVGILSIFLQRFRLGGILINGSAETIALAMMLSYFATWSDKFILFLRQRTSLRNLAVNKVKLDEFWLTWNNRVYFILILILLIAFLKNFNWYSYTKDSLIMFFETPRAVGELTFTYGGIALFIIVIYMSGKISSTVKFLAEDKAYYKSKKETANIAVITRFFLVTVGFIFALLVSGIPIDRITIIIGALSVGIGFGLQNIVNNLISGIILIFERPIQTGDLVELQQYTGFIKDIGIRSSVIRTYEGAEVIVPNGNLVSQEVINWTLSNRQRRVEMRVGVAYGSDVQQVIDLITEVLNAHNKVENYPAPAVLLDGFGDNSVDFRCLIWTIDIDNWLSIKSELSTSIYNALNEANITIPFPQRDIHVVSWDVEPKITSNNDPSGKAEKSLTHPDEKEPPTGFDTDNTDSVEEND